jgi:hypothetical protein
MASPDTKITGNANNNIAAGTIAWANTDNAEQDNDVGAQASGSVLGTAYSQYLDCRGFDFLGVPDDATLDGIEVKVKRKQAATGLIKDYVIKLCVSNALAGDNKADTTTQWGQSYGTITYPTASQTDLWNAGLDVAKLKDTSNFGVFVQASMTKAPPSATLLADVDYVSVTVYYTDAVGVTGNAVAFATNI